MHTYNQMDKAAQHGRSSFLAQKNSKWAETDHSPVLWRHRTCSGVPIAREGLWMGQGREDEQAEQSTSDYVGSAAKPAVVSDLSCS